MDIHSSYNRRAVNHTVDQIRPDRYPLIDTKEVEQHPQYARPDRVQRTAMFSVHTCPLANPGGKDAGGLNVYVRQLSRALARRNIAVDVFTRQRFAQGPRIVSDGPGVRIIHIDAGPTGPLPKESIALYIPEFIEHVEEFRRQEDMHYDRLHAHYWLSGLVTAQLRTMWQVPSLVMFHTLARIKNTHLTDGEKLDGEFRADGEQQAMDRNDLIIAANRLELEEMRKHYRLPLSKITTAPLGVDLRLFHPQDRAAARTALGFSRQHLIFSVGRIEPLKGFDTLVHAAAQLFTEHPQLRETTEIWIGGGRIDHDDPSSGTPVRRLQNLVNQLGLDTQVRLLGAIPQEELPLYYGASDCTVVPSHYESFGLVAIEAMASGIPVVASNVGGLSLTIKDGETGFLVPPRDASAFANRIYELLASPQLASAMGNASAKEGAYYSWETVANRIEQIYARFGSFNRPDTLPQSHRLQYATVCGCSE
ncbi:MAG: glycosyltransferase [Chloroflexi bacterium]|nr:glycosyltransferase [Chloroflexota bacterium]